jgi:hypothetical protein
MASARFAPPPESHIRVPTTNDPRFRWKSLPFWALFYSTMERESVNYLATPSRIAVRYGGLIQLLALNNEVIGPAGIVYSTAPKTAVGADGKTYYVKGMNNGTAFSEVAGCLLARAAGLKVPAASICTFEDQAWAGVEEVLQPIRNIEPWLDHREKILNANDLYRVIVVDTWLANDDRNMLNIVGSPAKGGNIELHMIDFEKSKALGRSPTIESTNVDPRRFWPTGELGNLLRRNKPAAAPPDMIRAVEGFRRQSVEAIVRPVAADVPIVDWCEDSIDALTRRSAHIRALLEEVWRAN